LAPEVLKKLENYESGRSLLLERIEDLSQDIARLTAENRSTREWFMSRIQLLWESTGQRDATIAESLKSILEHGVEMSRHFGLREFGEKLRALLKDPLDEDPRQTRLPFTAKTTAAPETEAKSKKRVPEVVLESNNKRRKVGGS
jgi:hypothetical protein